MAHKTPPELLRGYNRARSDATAFAARLDYAYAARLLVALCEVQPDRADKYIYEIVCAFPSEQLTKDGVGIVPYKSHFVPVIQGKGMVADWMVNGHLLRATMMLLRRPSGWHNAMRVLWLYSLYDVKKAEKGDWPAAWGRLEKAILAEAAKLQGAGYAQRNLYNYWLGALTGANEVDKVCEYARTPSNGLLGDRAACQLKWIHDDKAMRALRDLERENPLRYAAAEDDHKGRPPRRDIAPPPNPDPDAPGIEPVDLEEGN